MSLPPPPTPGGAIIYSPPIASKWIFTGLIVFAGAVADRWNPSIRNTIVGPIGFFITSLCAIAAYQLEFPPATFAILFTLLNAWAITLASKQEGFVNGTNTVDWVSNSKRWFVEKVLKERPLAIQEKDVTTYPVEGPSAQGSTSAGTT
jgi:hypothetical protein